MKLTRFAVFALLSVVLLPASLSAQNHKINQARGSEQRLAEVEEQVACTPYPEWTCFPSGSPVKAEDPEERAAREVEASRAAAYKPLCTSYPEWTCLPQANETQGSKVIQAKKAKHEPSTEPKAATRLPNGKGKDE